MQSGDQPGLGDHESTVEGDTPSQRPSTEIVHTNITLANNYRLELSKTMLALSAALFAFTTSFPPALMRIDYPMILACSWVALAISTIGGLLNLYGWEKFYISYRDYHRDYRCGKAYRKWITRGRRVAHIAQMLGLIVGISVLAAFVFVNRTNVKLAEAKETKSTTDNVSVVKVFK